MKLAKKIMAATLALTMAAGMASCGDKDNSSNGSSVAPGKDLNNDQKQIVDAHASELPDKELSNKTITWMAHYDICLLYTSPSPRDTR